MPHGGTPSGLKARGDDQAGVRISRRQNALKSLKINDKNPCIHMPDEARFFGTDGRTRSDAFYGCLSHEAIHWTSVGHRCARELGKRFGDDQYAAEEVIAETGASFIAARLGIANERTQIMRATLDTGSPS